MEEGRGREDQRKNKWTEGWACATCLGVAKSCSSLLKGVGTIKNGGAGATIALVDGGGGGGDGLAAAVARTKAANTMSNGMAASRGGRQTERGCSNQEGSARAKS